MGWATLIIGAGLFLVGVLGHNFGAPKRRAAQADEKRIGLFVLRIAAILIGTWLLIIGVANLLRAHRLKRGEPHAAAMMEGSSFDLRGSSRPGTPGGCDARRVA